MMEKITYTFPANCPVAALAGKTVTGGVPSRIQIGGRIEDVVAFATKIDGKSVTARISDKPQLAKLAAAYTAAETAEREQADAAKAAQLEAAVPGITELLALAEQVANDHHRYAAQFEQMMEDENNDGVRPPRRVDQDAAERLDAIVAANPRAALYLKAKRQMEGTHWADNTGKGAAGDKAMRILVAGGSTEEAATALAVRREWVD